MSLVPKRIASLDAFENAPPDLVSALRSAENDLDQISETVAGQEIRQIKKACQILLSENYGRAFFVAKIAREIGAPSIINLVVRFADQHSSYYDVRDRMQLARLQEDIRNMQPLKSRQKVGYHRMRKK